MAEDIDKEALSDYKAQSLADAYQNMQQKAFRPDPFSSPSENITNPEIRKSAQQLSEKMTHGLREGFVDMFFYLYQGPKQIDGIEFEGRTYGKHIKQARESGREPVIVKWDDLPKTLGFEKFLPKTP